jgi:hypothetical protein
MKKIILASESKKFTIAAMEFLSQLQEEPMFLVGGFTRSLNCTELIESSNESYLGLVAELVEQDREVMAENITFFRHSCQYQHINYAFEIEKLVTESRFADLLVVNSKLLGRSGDRTKPKLNFKQALHKAECPILSLPEGCEAFKRIAIAYDGKKESMFALKQFCYLFPQYINIPVEIIYLSEQEDDEIPNIRFLKEYAGQYFNSISICKININPRTDLVKWVSEKKDVLVIAGSYSRSGLLSSMTDSFIDPILDIQQLPVFITHH